MKNALMKYKQAQYWFSNERSRLAFKMWEIVNKKQKQKH